MGPPISATDEQNEKLAEALEFAPEDLDVNSAGLLTNRQQVLLDRIVRWRRGSRGCSILAVILSLGVLSIVGSAIMPGLPLPSQGDQFQFVVCSWLLVGGIALVIFLPALWLDHSRLADVRAGKVSVVEGRADLKSQDFKGQIYRTKAYYLIVGGTKFQLANERQFQAFRQGETYRIFYVRNPPAHTLLSAERLSVFGS